MAYSVAGFLVHFEKGGKGNSQEPEREVDGEIGKRRLEERIKDRTGKKEKSQGRNVTSPCLIPRHKVIDPPLLECTISMYKNREFSILWRE